MNVLVVQDEAPVASFIKRGLEAEGFAVRTACDGAEGLELSSSSTSTSSFSICLCRR